MRHLLNHGPSNGGGSDLHSDALLQLKTRAAHHFNETGHPFITLSYAQSLDGCIAAVRGRPLRLSGHEALVFTHALRAQHEAILVGVGTVIADNPQLTVRHTQGTNPTPIVLDTHLRLPPDAQILHQEGTRPIIAASTRSDPRKRRSLEQRGAHVITVPTNNGGLLQLDPLLDTLGTMGFESVMVEGGACVITSFLRERQAHHIVLTMVNMIIGGLRAVGPLCHAPNGHTSSDASRMAPRLNNLRCRWLGEDLIIEGDPTWDHAA